MHEARLDWIRRKITPAYLIINEAFMSNRFLTLIIFFITSQISFALPQNNDLTKIDQCYEAAVTTINQRSCGELEYAYYDKLLNQQYTQLTGLLTASTKPLLINAQQAWLSYRDKECVFNSLEHKNSTLEPLASILCYVKLNKARVVELQHYIKFYSS